MLAQGQRAPHQWPPLYAMDEAARKWMYQISEMRVWSILLKSIAQERSPETADVLQNDIPLFLILSLPSSAIEPASVSDDPGHPSPPNQHPSGWCCVRRELPVRVCVHFHRASNFVPQS